MTQPALMRAMILVSLLAVAALAGCLDNGDVDSDTSSNTSSGPAGAFPHFQLPDTISDLEPVAQVDQGGAAGLWVADGLAYLSGGVGLRIVDVTDPANPVVLASEVEGTTGSRDVDLLYQDGRTYAIMAHSAAGISVTDVTDPANPEPVTTVTNIGSAHNLAVVPGTSVVYNSRSISTHVPQPGATGEIDIIDFTDMSNPQVSVFHFPAVAMTVGGVPRAVAATTCHDVTFEIQLNRAYCAGVTDSMIWDVTDPLNIEILQVIDWPGNNIHHGLWGVQNGSILIIGDEFAGAAGGPICTPLEVQPYAALWFFDISNLATPIPLGSYQVPYDGLLAGDSALCTTHFGTPIEDSDYFVIGWYTAGTTIVDYSNPAAPTTAAQWHPGSNTNTWESRYWNGHIFTGDTVRGMDVLAIE